MMSVVNHRWVLQYWNDVEKKLKTVSGGKFCDAPKENVVFLKGFYRGSRPHGSPDKEYSMIVRGCDWYYLVELDGEVRWGGWNDDITHACGGWILHSDGRTETEMNHGRPSWLPSGSPVKSGVWIPQPWAYDLGLGCDIPPWQTFSWPHGHSCETLDDYKGCC